MLTEAAVALYSVLAKVGSILFHYTGRIEFSEKSGPFICQLSCLLRVVLFEVLTAELYDDLTCFRAAVWIKYCPAPTFKVAFRTE